MKNSFWSSFWKYALIFLGVFVVALLFALPFFGGKGGFGGRMMGRGMMFGGYVAGAAWLGWLFLALRILVPLIVLGLIIWGVVALVRRNDRKNQLQPPLPYAEGKTCKNCGKPLQADWANCPYCGKKTA